jgi:hypothetical protein
MSGSECACSCPAELMGDVDPYEFLTTVTGALHWIAQVFDPDTFVRTSNATDARWHVRGASPEDELAIWKQMVAALCDPGRVGEMYTSAAPYDPLFWVVHTTAERLLHYRRLLHVSGEMGFIEQWGYEHYMDMNARITPPSDSGKVCDWSSAKQDVDFGADDVFEFGGNGSFGQPSAASSSAASSSSAVEASRTNATAQSVADGMPVCSPGICPGHNADDVLPFGNFTLPKSAPKSGGFTNLEFYAFTAPHNPDLPYVYDNFAWEHCERAGYSFTPGQRGAAGDTVEGGAASGVAAANYSGPLADDKVDGGESAEGEFGGGRAGQLLARRAAAGASSDAAQLVGSAMRER